MHMLIIHAVLATGGTSIRWSRGPTVLAAVDTELMIALIRPVRHFKFLRITMTVSY